MESKGKDIRQQNIQAARALANAVRTSLGPRGMDKMIQEAKGEVVITNDGATILSKMSVVHPVARMLVELSHSQDVEAGDGTTSVVVVAGALLGAAETLLGKGIHPQKITDAFLLAADKAEGILEGMSVPVSLDDRETLIKNAATSLSSKVVAQSAGTLAPMAVDAVIRAMDSPTADTVDLEMVRVSTKLGGTVDDTEMLNGFVLTKQTVSKVAGGPTKMMNAKVGLIQFCLSPPKTDMENTVTIRDYASIDRVLKEEQTILARMVKKIQKTGCNVLLIQKSILRDAVTDLSLDFCAKAKIVVVRDVERDDIEFISKVLGCEPCPSLDQFTDACLGSCEQVCDESMGPELGSIVRFTGLSKQPKCVSILCRGSSQLVLDEAERSLHDALCVVRSLVKKRALIAGGGAPEMEMSVRLAQWSQELGGVEGICVRHFAEALEIIPATLAENAGLTAIDIVTKLRVSHHQGAKNAGINMRKGTITDILEENVVQPLLVSLSSLKMATETVRMILKIDDHAMMRG